MKDLKLNLILGIVLLTLVAVRARAEETESGGLRLLTDEKTTRAFIGPDLSLLNIKGTTFEGIGFDGSVFMAFGEQWGVGFSLRQGFSSSAFDALFTEVDFQLKYALTGSLRLRRTTLLDGSKEVYDSIETSPGGWRAQLFVHQYFLNTPSATIPVPGLGAGLAYEFPSSQTMNYTIGIRVDRASNGSTLTFYPIQLFLGIGVWLL